MFVGCGCRCWGPDGRVATAAAVLWLISACPWTVELCVAVLGCEGRLIEACLCRPVVPPMALHTVGLFGVRLGSAGQVRSSINLARAMSVPSRQLTPPPTSIVAGVLHWGADRGGRRGGDAFPDNAPDPARNAPRRGGEGLLGRGRASAGTGESGGNTQRCY